MSESGDSTAAEDNQSERKPASNPSEQEKRSSQDPLWPETDTDTETEATTGNASSAKNSDDTKVNRAPVSPPGPKAGEPVEKSTSTSESSQESDPTKYVWPTAENENEPRKPLVKESKASISQDTDAKRPDEDEKPEDKASRTTVFRAITPPTQFMSREGIISPRKPDSAEPTRFIPVPDETRRVQPVIPPAEQTQYVAPRRIEPKPSVDDQESDPVYPVNQAEELPEKAPKPRRARRAWITLGILLVIIVVAAGVLVASPTLAHRLGLNFMGSPETAPPPSPVAFSPAFHAPSDNAPVPSSAGVNSALSTLAADPALGTFTGIVLDANSGNVLWEHNSGTPMLPASTNKLLTSAAALLSLDPQSTLTTTVVAGSDPGTVILVGGGDPTLSSLSAPHESVYPGAARLDDLVQQIKQHVNGPIRRVIVDTSQYTGALTAPGWDPSDIQGGNYTPMVSAMMDGGRLQPTGDDSPRTANPAQDLASALASRLGAASATVQAGAATAHAPVLAQVNSAPIHDLISNLLQISDNVLAEAIGRQVARSQGDPESFTGATQAVLKVLSDNGFDTSGVSLVDSNGLSPQDRVTARLLASIMRVAAAPDGADPRTAKLRSLLDALPVAGGDGTLNATYHHFDTAASAAGKGWVRAKTGTLGDQGVNTLAGLVLDSDNRVLVFAFMSNGATSPTAPAQLDAMTAALRGCGCH